MTNVPETTIEAEQGFDYAYGYNYDFGLLTEITILTAATQPLTLTTPQADITGTGDATLDATAQDLTLTTPQATVTGAGNATLGASAQSLTLTTPQTTIRTVLTLSASTQPLALTTPQHAITGAGNASLAASTQFLSITTPQADITGTGDATLDATAQDLALTPVPADIRSIVRFHAATQTLELTTPAAQIGFGQWVVADTPIDVVGVRLTPEELSLEIRSRSPDAQTVLDDLDSNAGAFDTRERADGTIQNRDTAAGANSYTVTPPIYMDPPRTERAWRVDNVTRDRTSTDTEAIAATVTLVPAATRDPVDGYADTADADLWEFDIGSSGQVVTASVANIQQGETSAIELVLTPEQAELIETVTGAVAGAVTFVVPDGDTFTRDETPTDRQTVTITPPSSASDPAIPEDTYVVTGWESRGSDGGGYRLTLNISTRYE